MQTQNNVKSSFKFLALLVSLILISSFALATHDTKVEITPGLVSCSLGAIEYTVTITNIDGSDDSIREVRIYDDEDNDGNRDAGIVSFSCGAPPNNDWVLDDRLALFNYCQYETTVNNPAMIDPDESEVFTFTAELDDTNLQCGNAFRIATIDDATPTGQVVFKKPTVVVDCEAPVVTKMVGEPHIAVEACTEEEYQGENELACNYYATQETDFAFWGEEKNECDLGFEGELYGVKDGSCRFEYTVNGGNLIVGPSFSPDGNFALHLEEFEFEEDSEHEVTIVCTDIAGNTTTVTETDYIETVEPDLNKFFTGPFKFDEETGAEWIDTESRVVIEAKDPDPHPSGLFKTYWRNDVLENPENWGACYQPREVCNSYRDECAQGAEIACEFALLGEGGNLDAYLSCLDSFLIQECRYTEYTSPIAKKEESCHVLNYLSIDNLGNINIADPNCFFVDKTPPIITKKVGEPNVLIKDSCKVQGEGDQEQEVCDYYITTETPITLSCNDIGDHPANDVTIHYTYRVNDGNSWSIWTDTNSNQSGQVVLYFPETSIHELEYWCTDAVDKKSFVYTETDYVDDEPPIITKEMIGTDHLGECPPGPEPSEDECYVADNGENGVAIWVEDTPANHMVDNVSCSYQLWWDATVEECEKVRGLSYDNELNRCLVDGDKFSDHAEIIFHEDSMHTLEIVCEDELGNSVEETEEFLVDSTPPETTKTYGDPYFADPACVESCQDDLSCIHAVCAQWINLDTPITLEADDEKVGVDEIYWRNLLLEDSEPGNLACGDPEEFCNPEAYSKFVVNPEEPWNVYEGPFQKNEESCHVIEYYSVDLLGNEELVNWQCVFVDDSPPDWIKKVGEPRVIIFEEGEQCEEPEPEPSPFKVGDLVHQLGPDDLPIPGYTNHCSIGVAFDGESLYYNRCSDTRMFKIDPITGALQNIFDTGVLANAMAYDSTRNSIWFGLQNCDATGMPIYTWNLDTDAVTLEFHVPFATVNPATGNTFVGFCFLDGLAFNANGPGADDDEIWFSDDVRGELGVFRPDGTLVTGYDASTIDASLASFSPGLSGLAIGGPNLYLGNNGGGDVFRADSTTLAFIDQFASEDERLEDMECDPNTFAPTEVMWVRHTPQGIEADDLISAFAIEPGTCGLGGEEPPVCEGDFEDFVSQETDFLLDCEDILPHPVGHETLFYKVSLEDNGNEDITEDYCKPNKDGWCVVDPPFIFSFEEDTYHNLEFYCEDALGNQSEIDLEFFTVDTLAPEVEKTIEGPTHGDCSPEATRDIENDCFVDTATRIFLDAVDPQPHPVNEVECSWRYEVGKEGFPLQLEADWNVYNAEEGINFPEESYHTLEIICEDALGNAWKDTEYFQVDHTPPVTFKEFGDPYFSCSDWCYEEFGREGQDSCVIEFCAKDEGGHIVPQWATSDTNVFLSAHDEVGPHISGVAETSYRITLVDDIYCDVGNEEEEESPEVYCDNAEGSGEWQTYEGQPFQVQEESCHLIEYFSVDNVDKVEETNRECIYIDNQGPDPVKEVGEPSSLWTPGKNDQPNSIFYPQLNPENEDLCWNEDGDVSIDCWKVTLLTPVTMSCDDPDPHPVNHSSLNFIVELDGDDATEDYCIEYGGWFNEETGWCQIDDNELNFYFLEETEHNLKFYCEDALGNVGPIDDEKFKVEGTAFEIQLNKKWNLISVPFVLQDNNIAMVFEDIDENVDSVWSYDAFNDVWHVYRPSMPEASNLHTIDPGTGYWVAMLEPDWLVIGGALFSPAVTPPDKSLLEGWNLIGYYGNDSIIDGLDSKESYEGPDGEGRLARCALYSLGESVLDKGWTSLLTYWEPYNTDGDTETNVWLQFSYFDRMDSGAGYWINAAEDSTYIYTTNCGLLGEFLE